MAHLDDLGYANLERQYGRIGVIHWEGHQVVVRRPSREDVYEFRRRQASAVEAPGAIDYAAASTIVAFDGNLDAMRSRIAFDQFLSEYPRFTESAKFSVIFQTLWGRVEEEDMIDMGKGAFVRPSRRARTPEVSPSGSGTSSETSPSPQTAQLPPS